MLGVSLELGVWSLELYACLKLGALRARFSLRCGIKQLVQLFLVQTRKLRGDVADGAVGFHRNLGDFGGFVVADDGREDGAVGEAQFEVALALLAVGFKAGYATPGEDLAG